MKKYLILFAVLLLAGCSSVAVVPKNMETLDHDTAKIHAGQMHATTTQVNVNAGNTIYLKGISENDVHLIQRRVYATTTGNTLDYSIMVYEGGSDTGATNPLTKYNVKRSSPSNTTFEIYTSVTGVDTTTSVLLPFGQKEVSEKKFSNTATSYTEYILKEDTPYYLAITNNDGGILTLDLFWEFYEE
jgi:hypothetical protein